jgi:hypothetical protein
MMHYHGCPECYEKYPCEMKCSIEYDLQDGDREFGAYCICDECQKEKTFYSPEWWENYTGLKINV